MRNHADFRNFWKPEATQEDIANAAKWFIENIPYEAMNGYCREIYMYCKGIADGNAIANKRGE